MANTLEGTSIVKVRAMTKAEIKREGWDYCVRSDESLIALVLSNGYVVYPSRDDEGNGPGALFAYDKKSKQTLWLGLVS